MSTEFRYGLGDRAKDRISGLTGIIVSRAEHLFGCSRYWIQPEGTKDGKPLDGAWFDEDTVEIVDVAAIQPRQYRVVDTHERSVPLARAGGPTDQPSSQTRQTDR